MPAFRSFIEQALHYSIRTADGQPSGPVDHPAAWTGAELAAHPERWLIELSPLQLDELHTAALGLIDAGVALEEVTAERFPLPTLATDIANWRATLRSGLGVVCLRGFPVRDWGNELSAMAYWGLGHHLGAPGAQNPAGELLGHVTDYDEGDKGVTGRAYRTAGNIAFHCDTADVVGLLCLRTAAEGGASRIASSVTVFNELLSERPDLAGELFESFDIDRRDEQGPGEPPVVGIEPCAWDGTALRTFWHSDYMHSATRHESVEHLSDTRKAVLARYDQIAASEGIALDMSLREGDIQLISNHSVVHSRTAYVDHVEPSERRHLLRLWLSLEDEPERPQGVPAG